MSFEIVAVALPEQSATHLSPPTSPTLTQIALGSPISLPAEPDGPFSPKRMTSNVAYRPLSPPLPPPPSSWERPVVSASLGTEISDDRQDAAFPSDPASIPLPVGTTPELPLEDLSHYSEPCSPGTARLVAPTTLAELAHLVRLRRDLSRKYSRLRQRLYGTLVSNELFARLALCGDLAQNTLVDYLRLDDKRGFARLHDALHDVRLSCDATRRYAFMEPGLDVPMPEEIGTEKLPPFPTFLDQIPPKMRDDLLHFLSEIRTNPDFLAGRIASLSASELLSFSPFFQSLEPIDSVLSTHGRGKLPGSSNRRGTAHVSSPVEQVISFQRHDPLSGLLCAVFGKSGGPLAPEDLRRTDVWSSTCARLITEETRGGEHFMRVVLNAWATMREWPGKRSLELYLGKVLQDGTFLLDTADGQSPGVRPYSDPQASRDSFAAEAFYDRALKQLFEMIDDRPSIGGIPQGVLELGFAIVKKLKDSKKQRAARNFIIYKWFFSCFLWNAIVNPETHGMMVSHHIAPPARKKILKEVADRAQQLVWAVSVDWKPVTPIQPHIRSHIENILASFQDTSTSPVETLLRPNRSTTSARETFEVQPFFVVSVSDIVTLVNALFPDRRPPSAFSELGIHQPGFRSAASSISGPAIPPQARTPSHSGTEIGSLVSNSGSSVTSESVSQGPALDLFGQHPDGRSSYTSLGSRDTLLDIHLADSAESYGHMLRLHVSQLPSHLGSDATSGTLHPCAERWAVIFVSHDGKRLTTAIPEDSEGQRNDDDQAHIQSIPEEGYTLGNTPLEHNYDQLKRAVNRLLQEYEIPEELLSRNESKGLSNRFSAVHQSSERIGSVSKEAYHSRAHPCPSTDDLSTTIERQETHRDGQAPFSYPETGTPGILSTMLEAAVLNRQTELDFVAAHSYWEALQQIRQLSSSSLAHEHYTPLLNYFARGPRETVVKLAGAIETYEAWLVWLHQAQERHSAVITDMMKRCDELRNKMWYVTDVQHSAAYEEARNVAVALHNMARSARTSKSKQSFAPRSRSMPRSPASMLLLKTETHIMELMTASSEQGGTNKLSDEQSEMTLKWLAQHGIENFCRGEERIHRFCLEIDRCVHRLIGHDITDAPVLWSSELYQRDKSSLSSGLQKGDLYLTEFGTLRAIEPDDPVFDGKRPGMGYGSLGRSFSSAPRPGWTGTGSPQRFDVGKWSARPSKIPAHLLYSSDRFRTGDLASNLDAVETFWSPFLHQKQSQTGALGQYPYGAVFRREDTLLMHAERGLPFKRRFLEGLRQTLTELLLSDLGTMVWNQGSETDSWFSGELGERFLQPIDVKEPSAHLADLDSNVGIPDQIEGVSELGLPGKLEGRDGTGSAAPVTIQDRTVQPLPSKDASSIAGQATAIGSQGVGLTDDASPRFPYDRSFQALLDLFSTQARPLAKLEALHKLELMIRASLDVSHRPSDTLPHHATVHATSSTAAGSLPPWDIPRNNSGPSSDIQEPRGPGGVRGEETGRRMESRRHSTSTQRSMRERPPQGSSSTDEVVATMQDLFRDAQNRPKTLFRDLQFIAAFVPNQILDQSDCGRAFRHASLAAMGLKQDVCRRMIEMADDIVAYHTKTRARSLSPSRLPAESLHSLELSRFSMGDAAHMLSIAAKEGYPVAQRELAIFYLTHPDLVARTTLPLSKPRDTFKAQMMNQRDGEAARSDPATLCVAYHWMELSSQGGDELARQNMRAREELNALP